MKSEYDLNDRAEGELDGKSPPVISPDEDQIQQKLPKFKNNIELTQEVYENDQFDRLNSDLVKKETLIKRVGSFDSNESREDKNQKE